VGKINTLKFSIQEFREWLINRHIPSFKTKENIEAYLSYGLAFLFASGSLFLKRFIMERIKTGETSISIKTGINLNSAWNLLAQKLKYIEVSEDSIKLKFTK